MSHDQVAPLSVRARRRVMPRLRTAKSPVSCVLMSITHRRFLLSMATFWLLFGLGTTLYPRMMQMFMTPEGIAASTPFSDQVWLHGGLDILSVCLLLFALSTGPATKTTLRLAATVGLFPFAATLYTLFATPF